MAFFITSPTQHPFSLPSFYYLAIISSLIYFLGTNVFTLKMLLLERRQQEQSSERTSAVPAKHVLEAETAAQDFRLSAPTRGGHPNTRAISDFLTSDGHVKTRLTPSSNSPSVMS